MNSSPDLASSRGTLDGSQDASQGSLSSVTRSWNKCTLKSLALKPCDSSLAPSL